MRGKNIKSAEKSAMKQLLTISMRWSTPLFYILLILMTPEVRNSFQPNAAAM